MSETFEGIIVAPPFMPLHWYWKAEDGRIFSSERELVVGESDADYVAWVGDGRLPTEWPRDGAGAQTDAALQDVLTPYGLTVGLETFAAKYRQQIEDEGFSADGVDYRSDSRTVAMILIAGLADEDTFLIAADGSIKKLNRERVESVVKALHAMIRKSVQRYEKALAAIKAGGAKNKQQVIDIFRA